MTLVFTSLLITAAVVVSTSGGVAIRPIRTTGPAIKQWSGYILMLIGAWFVVLTIVPSPVFGA